jgi:mRNA-degrading endonuclease toxin of MazEF toxin-antitoxin module
VRKPSAGDLIELDVDEDASAQGARRAALVVSIDGFQDSGLAIVCPIKDHGGKAAKGRAHLEVPVPPGFAIAGAILSHQVKTIDWKARNAGVVDHLPRVTLLQVRARLKLFLGL